MPTIRDCSHETVMLACLPFRGDKIGKTFKSEQFAATFIHSLHPMQAGKSLSPRLWPSGAAMLGKGIMSHKYLTHSTRKNRFPGIIVASGNATNAPLWVPWVVHG